ncbi:MAG: hypothetical protein ACRD2B_11845 [Terriglobia bacterium]
MKKMLITLAAVVLTAIVALAQGPPPPPPPGGGMAHNFFFVTMGARRAWGKMVTGAPYSAETVTETRRALSDGNRIDRKETGFVYRDDRGRTRRERTFSMIGPWASAGKPMENTIIHDPVAKVTYILNPARRRAYKVRFVRPLRPPRRMRRRREAFGTVSTQSLAPRTIEGLKTEGTRTTTVIPTGGIGNEKPIRIISESWYSPKLQVYLLTKRNDPRFGETIYRLTHIKLGAPSPSLFQVPPGYVIQNMPHRHVFGSRPKAPGELRPRSW